MKAFALLLTLAVPAFSQEPPVYVNNLSVEAGRAMEKIAGRDPAALHTDAELVEWARARLAWVALRRLQGRESEALAIFGECRSICEKYGPEGEWKAARAWGCQKKREAKPCLSAAAEKKTKAQKPSH